LAEAIDVGFGRWDMVHMHIFTLADGAAITELELWDGEAPDGSPDSGKTKLSRLSPGEQFAYTFDFGDDWTHLCTVASERVDSLDTVGIVPGEPLPYFGWGDLPDQYGRRWSGDDGETAQQKGPTNPLTDLPPILPGRWQREDADAPMAAGPARRLYLADGREFKLLHRDRRPLPLPDDRRCPRCEVQSCSCVNSSPSRSTLPASIRTETGR
jgi:hypothetical protein